MVHQVPSDLFGKQHLSGAVESLPQMKEVFAPKRGEVALI